MAFTDDDTIYQVLSRMNLQQLGKMESLNKKFHEIAQEVMLTNFRVQVFERVLRTKGEEVRTEYHPDGKTKKQETYNGVYHKPYSGVDIKGDYKTSWNADGTVLKSTFPEDYQFPVKMDNLLKKKEEDQKRIFSRLSLYDLIHYENDYPYYVGHFKDIFQEKGIIIHRRISSSTELLDTRRLEVSGEKISEVYLRRENGTVIVHNNGAISRIPKDIKFSDISAIYSHGMIVNNELIRF